MKLKELIANLESLDRAVGDLDVLLTDPWGHNEHAILFVTLEPATPHKPTRVLLEPKPQR